MTLSHDEVRRILHLIELREKIIKTDMDLNRNDIQKKIESEIKKYLNKYSQETVMA